MEGKDEVLWGGVTIDLPFLFDIPQRQGMHGQERRKGTRTVHRHFKLALATLKPPVLSPTLWPWPFLLRATLLRLDTHPKT